MIEAKKNNIFEEIDEIKSVEVFESDNEAVFKSDGENLKNYRIYGQTENGESVGDRTKNLLQNTATSRTINGVTFTVNSDGSVTCNTDENGATASTRFYLVGSGGTDFKKLNINANAIITGCPLGGNVNTYSLFILRKNDDTEPTYNTWADTGNGFNLPYNETNKYVIYINISTGTICDDLTFYPMIRLASIEDDTYEPYGYKVPVTVEGKNLLPTITASYSSNGILIRSESDGTVIVSGTATAKVFPKLRENISYPFDTIMSGCPQGGSTEGYCLRAINTATSSIVGIDFGNGTLIPANTEVRIEMRIENGCECNNLKFKPMIRKADVEDDTYEPYRTPVTTPIYLPEQIKKVGDEAEYIDYGEQKQHRVRKNLLQNTATGQTINGVTFTANSDGSITCNGTASNTTELRLISSVFSLPIGTYQLNGAPTGGGGNTNFKLDLRVSPPNTYYADTGNGIQFNILQGETITMCRIVIYSGYTCNNLTFYPMIRLASITDDTYEPYIENTELDVTLPALPTVAGTNLLNVNTNIKPSKVWGRLSDPIDILYVKDNLGNILFSKYHEVEDEPPLSYTAKKAGFLTDYRIYGQTFDGESVGDRTGNLVDCDNTEDTEVNGIVWSCKNQIITANGATGNLSSSSFGHKRITGLYGSFILACVSDTNNDCICVVSVQETPSSTRTYNISTTNSYATFSLTGEEYEVIVYAQVNKNKEVNNAQFFISLTEGSTPPDTYEPYGYRVPVTVEGKNLLENTATSQTINRVTFMVNSDGSVTCNGTATDISTLYIESLLLPGNYILTGCPSNGSSDTYREDIFYTNNVYIAAEYGDGVQFSLSESSNLRVRIRIASGYTCDNLTFYPMIRKADIEDDTYEPYHAPITTPIYLPEQIRKVGDEGEYIDYREQKQYRVRKNLLQNTATSQTINGVTFTVNKNGSVTCNGTATGNSFLVIKTMPNFDGTCILSGCPSNGSTGTYCIQYSNMSTGAYSDIGSGVRINHYDSSEYPNARVHIKISVGYTCDNLTFYPMIRKADIEDDTYEPYIENTDLDVTLPALPTVTGTNVLSVGTEVQPSDMYIKGKLKAIN